MTTRPGWDTLSCVRNRRVYAADGSRVNKNSTRIHAFGDIDELNCLIGRLVANEIDEDIKSDLLDRQHILFDLGGDVLWRSERLKK